MITGLCALERRRCIERARRLQAIEELRRKARKARHRSRVLAEELRDLSIAEWHAYDLRLHAEWHTSGTPPDTFCNHCSRFAPGYWTGPGLTGWTITGPIPHVWTCTWNPVPPVIDRHQCIASTRWDRHDR